MKQVVNLAVIFYVAILSVVLVFPTLAIASALNWAECVMVSRENQPAIRAARESVRSAQAALKSSRAAYLPDVDGDVSYSRAHSSSTKDDYAYAVSASQRLYPGLTDRPEVAQARARLWAAQAAFDATVASVRFDLKSAFTELGFSQENIALAETIAVRRTRNVLLVKARFDAGREHKGSYQRAKAQSDQADFDVRQARRALKVARQKLLRAMGRDTVVDLVVWEGLPVPSGDADSDLQSLAEATPAVRKAQADRDVSTAQLTITRREFSPTLTATASADRNGGAWPPRSTSGDWTGRVTMSVPLFKGGQEKYDVAAAEANLANLEASLQNTADQAVLDLEDRRAALSDAVENVSVRQGFLDAAILRAEIAQAQYTSGLLTFDDWDIIENDLISQQKSSLAARRDAILGEARWELAFGKGLEP